MAVPYHKGGNGSLHPRSDPGQHPSYFGRIQTQAKDKIQVIRQGPADVTLVLPVHSVAALLVITDRDMFGYSDRGIAATQLLVQLQDMLDALYPDWKTT